MDNMRFAVVDRQTRIVVNTIEAPEDWTVDAAYRLVRSETAGKGDSYNASALRFTPAPVPAPEPSPREQYEAATTDAERLAVIARRVGLSSP